MNVDVELYTNSLTVHLYEGEDSDPLRPLYVIEGKDWDGDSFKLFVREDEAKMLAVQLGYHLYEKE